MRLLVSSVNYVGRLIDSTIAPERRLCFMNYDVLMVDVIIVLAQENSVSFWCTGDIEFRFKVTIILLAQIFQNLTLDFGECTLYSIFIVASQGVETESFPCRREVESIWQSRNYATAKT